MIASPPRLCELNNEGRAALATALAGLRVDLEKLEGGAGFCEDRGGGWSLIAERGYRESIQATFHRHPVLRRLMHSTWVLLATDQTVGDRSAAMTELAVAEAALAGQRTFEWTVGEGYARERRQITLEPSAVLVRNETLASTAYGVPFSADAHRYAYDVFAQSPLWLASVAGMDTREHTRLLSIFWRWRRCELTCDVCGACVGSVGLTHDNTLIEATDDARRITMRPIALDEVERLRTAMIEYDLRAIHALDPSIVPAYCSACDHVYCAMHIDLSSRPDSPACGGCRCERLRDG